MKNVGLYFGSYNPIHLGHLSIAQHIVDFTDLEEIWFVVSPHNPLKEKNSLANEEHRLEMVRLATEKNDRFLPSDIEFELPSPSYTVNTLKHLSALHPAIKFDLIMGEDNLNSFNQWKDYEYILENYHTYVYPRKTNSERDSKDQNLQKKYPDSFTLIDGEFKNISATEIRKRVIDGKEIREFLTKNVESYISRNRLYSKA